MQHFEVQRQKLQDGLMSFRYLKTVGTGKCEPRCTHQILCAGGKKNHDGDYGIGEELVKLYAEDGGLHPTLSSEVRNGEPAGDLIAWIHGCRSQRIKSTVLISEGVV